LRQAILQIENALISELKPTFFTIQHVHGEKPFIHIVISHRLFDKMEIMQRVSLVYKILLEKTPDIVEALPIIVETFNSNEMVEVIEHFKY
jgi:stress-induced morphogen